MKKKLTILLLAAAFLLCGCQKIQEILPEREAAEVTETTEATVPATIPADGNPDDATCKGSYTDRGSPDTVVAASGTWNLTNEQLSVWYWAEVAQYQQENHEIAPNFERPLDMQACEIDSSVNTWQQYFLKQALSAWHTAQSLDQYSVQTPLPLEQAYQPNQENHEKYMTGMPATKVLYGYNTQYTPNSLHQAYLDGIPQMLEALARERGYADAAEMAEKAFGASLDALSHVAASGNRSYMYFTTLSYYIEPTEEELDAFYQENASAYTSGETSVDFLQILLVPGEAVYKNNAVEETVVVASDGTVTCSEEAWAACEADAQDLLAYWRKKTKATEATFADTANKNSKDAGTALDGGKYLGIRKGQMTKVVDQWCFDPARQPGDTEILLSEYGVHILYFSGSRTVGQEAARKDYYRQQQNALIAKAKESFPIEITYSAISLTEAEGTVAFGQILYPEIAHERFPEVPLYLQQDYPDTKYGAFPIRTNGCGITSLAMVASYLADDELTPPEMCARYGRYSHANGTDGMIFNHESSVMGFYLREKTYDARVALQALEEGHLVVSVQHPGYWTRGGHYIVCESINEEGLVQVRDSNIYNYVRVQSHAQDVHKWGNITAAGSGYWIFDHKITRIPACSRCGDPNGLTQSLLNQEYTCEKCAPALLRRETYLNN